MYAWCLEQVGPQGREKFEHDLTAPLPGDETASPAQAEAEGEAFMAAMAMAQQQTTGG